MPVPSNNMSSDLSSAIGSMSDPIVDEMSATVEEEFAPLRKRGPVEDKLGQSSVMPETMATAARVGANFAELAEDIGEATGAVATHELYSRVKAPTQNASAQERESFIQSHTAKVQRGGATGKQAGQAVGASAVQMFLAVARRAGAHQCDACGRPKIYNYWTCEDSACMNEQQRLGLEGGYDLCEPCYEKLQAGEKIAPFHSSNHRFFHHNNAEYTGKILLAVVLFLILVKFFLSRIF